jgi:hypothetical protein
MENRAREGGATEPFDPVDELERLHDFVWRRRRMVLIIAGGFVFLFVLALVQFLGTLYACKLLADARHESARVHRETAVYLDEIRTTQEWVAQQPRPEPPQATQRPIVPVAVPAPDSTDDPGLMTRDVPPEGAVLVGFRVGICQENGPYVASLQPIYLTGKGEMLGTLRGKEPALVIHYRAKPRYAVGAIKVRTAPQLAMQITYMRCGGRFLEKDDAYDDEWIGAAGANTQVLGGDGGPVVGLLSSTSIGDELKGLGLVRVKRNTNTSETQVLIEPAEAELDNLLDVIRTAIEEKRLTP